MMQDQGPTQLHKNAAGQMVKRAGAVFLFLAFSACLTAQTPVALGTAGSFSVLAGSTVTSTGPTIVTGNVGVSPGSAVTGFPPGIVTGGAIHAADAVAAQAQNDLTTAYNDAAGRGFVTFNASGDIGGQTILPGVYRSISSTLGITGTVTLNGNGNPNAVFIFQIPSTLTTATGNSIVNLINGAQASNVFWQVGSSATLGTNTLFNGTILALTSITLTTGAVLNGRALARNGAVTLDSNSIANPGTAGTPPGTLSLGCPAASGQFNQLYTSALVATGGLQPYTYSIIAGNLPPPLTLNSATGTISGTPAASSVFAFTARVVDSTSAAATANCSITILAPPPPPGVPVPPTVILVMTGMAFVGLYQFRTRLLKPFRS